MNNTRYVNNKAILSKLSDLIDKYPDMRFNQLLWATGIIANDENGIIDKFYEERRAIIHFAFHLMIIVKIIYRIIY